MQRQKRLWWQFKGGGREREKKRFVNQSTSCFVLIVVMGLFFSFPVVMCSSDAMDTSCPPCHFFLNERGGSCVPVPEGTDPNNDCGGTGPNPRLFCGVEKTCGRDAVCQIRTQPLCDCNFKTGICVLPALALQTKTKENDTNPEEKSKLAFKAVSAETFDSQEPPKSPILPGTEEINEDVFVFTMSKEVLIGLSIIIAMGPIFGICLITHVLCRQKRNSSNTQYLFDLENGNKSKTSNNEGSNTNSPKKHPQRRQQSERKDNNKKHRLWYAKRAENDTDIEDDN